MRTFAPLITGVATAFVVAYPSASKLCAQDVPTRPTFTEHIAPILHANCTGCHRKGELAPFELASFSDARKRAKMIQRVTQSRYMPPWHPEEGWGEFRDPRRLTDAQIATIAKWVEVGRPEGPKAAMPALPKFPAGWQLGKPDLVVEMPEGYSVRADGSDIYRNFVIPLELEKDLWVQAIEVRPSAKAVLHHTLFFSDADQRGRRLEARDRSSALGFRSMGFRGSGQLGGWAVGGTPRRLPLGLAWPLRKGSDLVLSSHFHPSGKAEVEKTKLGIYLAKKVPERELLGFQVPVQYGAMWGIDIPAGEANYVVNDSFILPCDIELVGAGGHAHYLCKSMRAIATLPSGEEVKLISIPRWDFNWQGRYHYAQPVELPKGTKVSVRIVYDNSESNPQNPHDPPRRVRWGLESTDEMGSLIFSCVAKDEKDVRAFKQGRREQMRARRRLGASSSAASTRTAMARSPRMKSTSVSGVASAASTRTRTGASRGAKSMRS